MITPTQEQVTIVEAIGSHQKLKVSARAGAAKSQPVWASVKTPNGDKPIGSLAVGDSIFSASGKVQTVVGVFPQGQKETFEIEFRDGSKAYSSLDHLWAVKRDGYPKVGNRVMTLGEILSDGLYLKSGAMKFKVPLSGPVEYDHKDHFIHPYVLGFILGDGYLCGNTPAVSFGEKDIEAYSIVEALLPEGFNLNGRKTSANCTQATITSSSDNSENKFMAEIKRLGLNVGSLDKFIPTEYLFDSVENRMELLRGIMDSDGSCSGNRVRFSTTSERLGSCLVELVQSLGGTCIAGKPDERADRVNTLHNYNVKMFYNPFKVGSKSSLWKFSEKNPPSRYIKSVKYFGCDEHVCIKVSSEDSLYLTDNYVVTHNTTTLVLAAEAYQVPSLYIAYNKHMAEDARSKFPSHVEVRTAHSYAYQSHAEKIKHKLVRIPGPGGKYNNVCGTGSEIARYFKIAPLVVSDNKSITAAAMGYAVKSTVANFEYSGERELSWKHVSYREAEKVFTNVGFDKIAYRDRVLKHAKKLWELRIDPNSDILATHDTYLKLWQLSNPTFAGYEIIYVDEFQDMNGCLLDVVMNHKGKIVGVGDDHQSIYGWRGSLNAMQICDWPEFGLTKSFRFGQEVAEVAKDILLNKYGQRDVVFFGNENITTEISQKTPETGYTMIFRTNSALIEHGLDLIIRGKRVNMHIDVSEFKSMMNSAYALFKGDMKNVKHADIVPFVSWAELCEEIGVVRNAELKRIHKFIVDGRFHAIMDTLANYKRVDDPDVELISGHKSKGLEFDHVVLADDFEFHEVHDDGSWKGFSGQEQNLLYVAATRAKKGLKINDQIVSVREYGEGRECGRGLKLESVDIYKYEPHMSAPNLMAYVEQRMAEFGVVATDLDHFIEGHPDAVPEHWENLEDGVPRFGN